MRCPTGYSEARSPAYGPILGLVVGNYAEARDNVHRLIYRVAERIGVETGLAEGAPTVEATMSTQKQVLLPH